MTEDILHNVSWDDLRTFLAVIQTGSLSRAADELGLTQPTVGRRLDRLEAEIGAPLVRRTTQGCEPTPRGATLIPLIAPMRLAADEVSRVVSSTQNDLAGIVRVATGDLTAWYLAGRLHELLADAPELRLEMSSSLGFVSLERGDADLALRTRVPEGDMWVAREIGWVPFAVFGSDPYLDAHPEAFDPAARKTCKWIGFDASRSVASLRWLTTELGRPPDIAFSTSLVILQAAAAGAGLAVLPVHIGLADPRLRQAGEVIDGLGFGSYLVIHPSARRIPRVRWVAERLYQLMSNKG